MKASTTRLFLCSLALAGAAACATSPAVYSAGGDVDLSRSPSAVLTESELQLLRGMSDGNIIGHLLEVDSIEIAAADTVVAHSRSDDINTYAKLMRSAHGADRTHLRMLSQETSITPTIDVVSLRGKHVAASLDSVRLASDVTIERHYLMSQIQLHQHVLAELEILQGVARNDGVRRHIVGMIPVVRDHLSRANALASARGIEIKRMK